MYTLTTTYGISAGLGWKKQEVEVFLQKNLRDNWGLGASFAWFPCRSESFRPYLKGQLGYLQRVRISPDPLDHSKFYSYKGLFSLGLRFHFLKRLWIREEIGLGGALFRDHGHNHWGLDRNLSIGMGVAF